MVLSQQLNGNWCSGKRDKGCSLCSSSMFLLTNIFFLFSEMKCVEVELSYQWLCISHIDKFTMSTKQLHHILERNTSSRVSFPLLKTSFLQQHFHMDQQYMLFRYIFVRWILQLQYFLYTFMLLKCLPWSY